MVADIAPEDLLVDAMGFFGISSSLVFAVTPTIGLAIYNNLEPEAMFWSAVVMGVISFALSLPIKEHYPDVLIECSAAIKLVRERAKEWHTDPGRVSLMGFSAGACLAGMSATQWNAPEIASALGVEPAVIRPDAAVIAYGCWDNSGTIWNNPEFVNPGASQFPKSCPPQLDLINYVGEHVCPLFIWHNQNDKYVPVRNCLMIAEKMCELRIPVELHLYTGGHHGMSVANPLSCRDGGDKVLIDENPNIQLWTEMCANWLMAL